MQEVLQHIASLQTTLADMLPMKREAEELLAKKFRLEFNYNSNHIEGNTLTYGQTELLLIFEKTDTGHEVRELDEMKGHDVAYKLLQDWAADPAHRMTERDVRELNQIILVRPFWKEALTPDGQSTRRLIEVGTYKKHPNSVRLQNGEMYHYTSPTDTPMEMEKLFVWLNKELDNPQLHPVQLAAMLHYKFVCIHPFDDGNGRLSRLLMNYIFLKFGYPPVIVKSKDKKNYLLVLNAADTGNLEAFVKYIAEQLVWSLELKTKAARGERLEEPDDLDKEIALLSKSLSADENVLNKKVDLDTIGGVVEDLFLKVAEVIEAKLAPLREQFMEKSSQYIASRKFNISKPTSPKEFKLDGQKLLSWVSSLNGGGQLLISVKYEYCLKAFRKGASASNFEINFEIFFNDYNFSISHPDRSSKGYPYGKHFTDEEINQIAAPFIKQLLEDIKRESNQK